MDPTLGIVIVAVVGALSPLGVAVLQNSHASRMLAAQKVAEAKAVRRDKLLAALNDYMASVETAEAMFADPADPQLRMRQLREVAFKEFRLAAVGDERVAEAAREVTIECATTRPGLIVDPSEQTAKDALVDAVREALRETPALVRAPPSGPVAGAISDTGRL
jgi:hypothetical protein